MLNCAKLFSIVSLVTLLITGCVTVYDNSAKVKSHIKSKIPEVKYVGYLGDELKAIIVFKDSVYSYYAKDLLTGQSSTASGRFNCSENGEKTIYYGLEQKLETKGDDIFLLKGNGEPVTKKNGYPYYLTKVGNEIYQDEIKNWKSEFISYPAGYGAVREKTDFGKYIGDISYNKRDLSNVHIENYFNIGIHPLLGLWAEYLWSKKDYEKIYFKNLYGWSMTYKEWCNAYSKKGPDSFTSLVGYLDDLFSKGAEFFEIESVSIDDIQTGDFFLNDNVVAVVVAIATTNRSGDRIFRLARVSYPNAIFKYLSRMPDETENLSALSSWFDLENIKKTGSLKTKIQKYSVGDLKRIVR